MDIVGVILVISSIVTSLVGLKIALTTFKTFGTTFYRYLTLALFCFAMMPVGYFFQLLILDPAQHDIVLIGTVSFNVWAYGGLACVVGAVENLKDRPNTLVIDFAFVLTGLLVAGRFLPTYQELTFSEGAWEISFNLPLMIIFGIFYLYVAAAILPYLLRLWYRIKRSGSFGYKTRILFLGTIVAVIYSAIVLVVNRGESVTSSVFLHSQAYLLFVILGVLFLSILLQFSPTIFFSTTDDIIYLGLVRSKDNVSLLGYRFGHHEIDVLSYLVTGVHSTLSTILQEAIRGTEDLKQISIGRDVITLAKGKNVTGFIVSDREIEILNPLLVYTLELFERKYGHEIFARHDFPEFKMEIERIFQFALISDEISGWINIPSILRRGE